MQIFKYPIEIGKFAHELPEGAEILAAQMQKDQPFFWAKVNTDNKVEIRHFEVIGTGHEFQEQGKKYLSTFQQGPFVWHLHELAGL